MTHSIRRYMDAVQTICEGAAKQTKLTPAQRFVQTVQAGPRCKHCTFEVEGPRTVLLTWLEGGGGLVPYLTQIADKLRVKLTLMVEVVDTAYGGKLVRYYEKNGFEIKESDFDDDFDFMTMEPDPSDEMKGQVYMERKPYAKQTIGEGAAAVPSKLYHGTSTYRLGFIRGNGLRPQKSAPGVYLATAFHAEAYAGQAVEIDLEREGEESEPVILVVDTSMLNPGLFGPDDYEMEDEIKRHNPRLADYTRAQDVPWQLSFDICEQITYHGIIPSQAISVMNKAQTLGEGAAVNEAAPASDESYINAHRSGDIIWIDMMGVPDRGKGIGRRYYEQWEAKLPPDIKLIRLMAADAGHGPSNGFWEAMGFEYQYAGDDLDYETSQYMWKGVNGHPTPPTVNADEDDDE